MLCGARGFVGVMCFTGTARPEMRAGVVFLQNLFADRTVTISLLTDCIHVMSFFAVGTVPAVFTGFIGLICFFTDGTVPTLLRTIFSDTVSFAALNAKPRRCARFICRMRFGANGTEPRRFRVLRGQLVATRRIGMSSAAGGATPSIFEKRAVFRMNVVANRARPALASAGG